MMGLVTRAHTFVVWLCLAAVLFAALVPGAASVAILTVATYCVVLTAAPCRRPTARLYRPAEPSLRLLAPRSPPLAG